MCVSTRCQTVWSNTQERDPPETLSIFRLAYPAAFESLVQRKCDQVGMDPSLIWAIMRQESAFAIRALSWASAQGLMQIIPRTGRKIAAALEKEDYDVSMLRTPDTSIEFGSWYFAELLKKFHGHPALAIASYNAGPQAVSRWVDARPGSQLTNSSKRFPIKRPPLRKESSLKLLRLPRTELAGLSGFASADCDQLSRQHRLLIRPAASSHP